MKRILLLLLVGASLTCPVLAQDNDSTPPPPHGGPGGPGGMSGMRNLTPDERKQVFTDREAALKANPNLADQEKALHEKMMALEKQIAAAMIKEDPSVAPILAKMHSDGPHHHKDGGDSTPPSDNGSSN